ncbi:hypothetical protein G6514_004259 [Epicoccum nigrum]|nr:hypothetical protein G6514_004259 [Epicoccum nigrum]
MDHNINPTNDLTQEERDSLMAQAKHCLNIINYKPDGERYSDHNGARTNPNQRLVEAFGIHNAFTHVDFNFSNNATKKMRAACKIEIKQDSGDWTDLRKRAKEYLIEYLERKSDSKSIYLAELVQFITLKLSLSYLFDDADAAAENKDVFKDVVLIGREINNLWINLKNSNNERLRWEDQHELHKALRNVTTAQVQGSFPEEDELKDTIEP